ncbi:DsbE family thiol:disulfide interchange protein [Methylobacterium brachythecii]|uniref:Cytochrome c biogenesis protein CcmG/thiol:disulfide interchange protein DsbE n=1 Tax=Methylobacterium brachythecii TaxID=1176177 RepID=A0A7W6F9D4_9HYPH|nr:DsbE family thiol:disulfide interchange protein [Methylobacterium brachythecii]MBB3905418.1 cytochrome c biogenesis protein CcmG/thiol:disulfide interchange protein DsbE [Methylobacterium brachythecii]GLS44898.1 thiol:disulfide interchange protein CycY [Methylobacterium brachythecii]
MNESRLGAPTARRSLLVILPVVTFAVLAGVFFLRLRSGADPAAVPSVMIGKAAPGFQLPPVAELTADGKPVPGLSSEDFKGNVTLLNFYASWCAPCQVEHPMLMRLARESGFRVVGIDYKDTPEAGRRFLARNGVPYAAVGSDTSGRVGIDFGVYGVPESFIIGPDGTIRDKLVGIVTPENYAGVVAKLRAAGQVAAAN